MRALPREVRARIDELQQLAYQHPARHTDRMVTLLAEIGATGEWGALPWLLRFLDDRDAPVAAAVAAAVDALVQRVPVLGLPELDRALRQGCDWHWDAAPHDYRWTHVVVDRLQGPWMLCLASGHPSGYVREAAVKRLAGVPGVMPLACLLIRLNDWVPQIRHEAARAIRHHLAVDPPDAFIPLLPLVDRIQKGRRIDSASPVREIEARLADPACAGAMAAAMRDPDRQVRRAVFRRVLSAATEHGAFTIAVQDPDPSIRRLAVQQLLAHSPGLLVEMAPRLLRDPSGRTRMLALQALLDSRRAAPVKELLHDRHAGVRALAQSQLVVDDQDPAAHYRAALAGALCRRIATALLGLGECGDGGDAALVDALAAHPAPDVRAAALVALGRLRGEGARASCLAGFLDSSPSVTRAAAAVLSRLRPAVAGPAIMEALAAAPTSHGKRRAFSILATLDYWERLPCLLQASSMTDPDLAPLVDRALKQWLRRSDRCFSTPTTAQAETIQLEASRARVAEPLRAGILAILKSR